MRTSKTDRTRVLGLALVVLVVVGGWSCLSASPRAVDTVAPIDVPGDDVAPADLPASDTDGATADVPAEGPVRVLAAPTVAPTGSGTTRALVWFGPTVVPMRPKGQ